MNRENIQRFSITAFLAALGSTLVGLVFFRQRIFVVGGGVFQFFSFGVVGGIVFSSFRFLKGWIADAIVVLLLVLNETVLILASRALIWQDVLYFAALCTALFVFSEYYFSRLAGVVLSRPLVLSSLLAVCYAVVTVILYFIYRINPVVPQVNFLQMVYYDLAQGFLIGFGIGAGIEAADYIAGKVARSAE